MLIIVMPLILLQVISAYIFYERHWDRVARRLALGVAGDIATVIRSLDEFPGAKNRQAFLAMARNNMNMRITLKDGAILPNVKPPAAGGYLDRTLSSALDARVRRPYLIDSLNFDSDVEIKIQLPGGVLQILVTRHRLFSSTTYVFVMWMVGSSLILFAVAMIFMRNQVRPIRRLAHAADNLGKGREVPNFKPQGALEVRQTATAFNIMRERIRRQINQRTEMLAGVSHDLRTPLTRMKLQVAMLGNTPETAELKADVEEMEKMIEGYLEFARGEGTEEIVPTDLDGLLHDVANSARRAGNDIRIEANGAITVPLRPAAFKRCLTNLVDNATRHGNEVVVSAVRVGTNIEVIVDDDGPGIPEEQRTEVFQAFHRLDDSRNLETGGVGLGLTIARDVMLSQGGTITLDQSPAGGLRARLRLPL